MGQVPKTSNGSVSELMHAPSPAAVPVGGGELQGAFFPAGGLSRPKTDPARVTPPEEALVGRVLDQRYRIEEAIGFGGMGVVYKARHVIIDKPLAIKLLRQEHAAQADIIKRFLLEAQVASRVKHPNIVDISDYGQIPGGTAYYAMEYLTGETLAARIDTGGRLEPQLALEIAVQILHGLHAAHTGKIIHRDLKSENIFLCEGPEGGVQIKILDFGIARLRDKKTRLTANGALIGTPAYMSPEQAQGQDADERSDLYAFGVILFEMLAGQVPFKLPTVAMVLSAQIFDTPPGLREVEPAAPDVPNIERFIRLLLAKNRDERPQSAAEAISLLKAAAELDAGLAGGGSRNRRPTVTLGSWGMADGNDLASVRGETPVPPGNPDDGDSDAATTRAVSPSGRIERRPSVIVQHGTHVERIAAPPTRAQTGEITVRPPITGVIPGPRTAGGGPPTLLIVAAAASIGAALTVTLYKQYYRKPVATPPASTAPAVLPQPPARVNLTFESDPPGAKVLRDGVEELGVTPFVFAVDPQGPLRRYVFRLADHHDAATEVAPGKSHERVRVIMRPLPPPAAPSVPPEPTPAPVGTPPTPSPTPAEAKTPVKPRGTPKPPAPSQPEPTPPQPEQKPEPETDDSDIGELKNPFPKKK